MTARRSTIRGPICIGWPPTLQLTTAANRAAATGCWPTSPQPAGDITWNFEKFLIGKDGSVVARFSPKTQPDSPEVVKAIEAELAK